MPRPHILKLAGAIAALTLGLYACDKENDTAAPSCAYVATSSATQFGAPGGTGTLTIQTTSSCSWTVTSNSSWVAFTGSASGQGDGSVPFSVATNSGADGRTATLIVGGQNVALTQAGSGGGPQCTYTLAPASISAAATGLTGSVSVTTQADCRWTAVSQQPWIAITSGATGVGGGATQFVINANNQAGARQGSIEVGGQSVSVTQLGSTSGPACTFSLNPPSASYSWQSTTGTIRVDTQASCVWSAVSQMSWVSITSGAQGTGSGIINYAVDLNNSGASRMGVMSVSGRMSTISQTANPCPSTVEPAAATIPAAGATGTLTVTIAAGCPWFATSQVPWITIMTGASGNGNGQVQYVVAANSTGAERVGTLTVAGQTITITQPASLPIAAFISPGIRDRDGLFRRPEATLSR